MLLFKPIDEMSLRHLFSSSYAQDVLGIHYLGPVLNPVGKIESSPDCIVWDRRNSEVSQPRRCEFKFMPSGKNDFKDNGNFDIAVIWQLKSGLLEDLKKDLFEQNKCTEVLVLQDCMQFQNLPDYEYGISTKQINSIHVESLRKIGLKSKCSTVFSFCIAAKLGQQLFSIKRMVNLLDAKFPEVKNMKPQGKSNVVSAGLQTSPPVLKFMNGDNYCWAENFDSKIAYRVLSEMLTMNFRTNIPTEHELKQVLPNNN